MSFHAVLQDFAPESLSRSLLGLGPIFSWAYTIG